MTMIYGSLKIISEPRSGGCGIGKVVTAQCVCGTVKECRYRFITSGHTTSCGCILQTHGLYKHPLYKTWLSMKERCYNHNHAHYKDYGGRGIKICDAWKDNAKSFIEWCEANGWRRGLQVDRRENDGHYEPNNCRISTRMANMRNRRNTVKAVIDGIERPLAEWAEIYTIDITLVRNRMRIGWPTFQALTIPVLPKTGRRNKRQMLYDPRK